MQFCSYPKHEHGCPNVSHCSHLGGAALGTLVLIADTSGDTMDGLHKAINAERKRSNAPEITPRFSCNLHDGA